MLRLMKYEMRKNISSIVILFSIIMGLEGYFLISALTENREHTAISAGLLAVATMVAYFSVFALGIATYSKELKSKSGYMTFMTPISSYSIIGSKLLATLIEGTAIAILLVVLALADMALFENVYPETRLLAEFLEIFVGSMGHDWSELLLSILATVIELLVGFFAVVSIAYLAITLSSTAFQNKKFKGIISAAIFIGIAIVVGKVSDFIPYELKSASMSDMIVAMLPTLIYYSVLSIGAIYASGILLEKKVSL